MTPVYMQAWGLARAFGGAADPYRLVERRENGTPRWALDVPSLDRAVTKKTRAIAQILPQGLHLQTSAVPSIEIDDRKHVWSGEYITFFGQFIVSGQI